MPLKKKIYDNKSTTLKKKIYDAFCDVSPDWDIRMNDPFMWLYVGSKQALSKVVNKLLHSLRHLFLFLREQIKGIIIRGDTF